MVQAGHQSHVGKYCRASATFRSLDFCLLKDDSSIIDFVCYLKLDILACATTQLANVQVSSTEPSSADWQEHSSGDGKK